MAKEARPEMSWIENRKKWRKRITVNGKKKDVYGNTMQEVRNQIKELRRQEDAGLAIDDSTTFFEYATRWLPTQTAGLTASGKNDYVNSLNKHITPHLADMNLRDIKPIHIKEIMAKTADKSRSLQSAILITMRKLFESAVHDGLIIRNPTAGIKAGGKKAKEKTPLTKEQQEALVKAIKGEELEVFVLLCLYAGLRREEALGLQWRHVYLEDTPHIDIRNTLTYPPASGKLSHILKSNAATRSIPLPDILQRALLEAKGKARNDFVISAPVKDWGLSQQTFSRWWKIVKDKLDFHVHPHLLRHTYITSLCASGMDIKKIQYLAGHTDPAMTLKIYTHVVHNRPEELISAIQGAFPAPDLGVKSGVKRRYRIVKAI